MAGRMSRNKGARGEREIIALLQPIVDEVCEELGEPRFILRRNQDQRFAKKQYDVIGIPWMAMEVKRVENQSGLGSWWRQTLDATLPRQIPCLFYRQNHKPWNVKFRPLLDAGNVNVRGTVTVDIDTFLIWFRERLKSQLRPSVSENRD